MKARVCSEVLKRLRKPLIGHLDRQSNPLNFKAKEGAQRRLDRLPSTKIILNA